MLVWTGSHMGPVHDYGPKGPDINQSRGSEGGERERGREEEWKADDKRKTGINHSGCLTETN